MGGMAPDIVSTAILAHDASVYGHGQGGFAVQALIELLIGFIALLAAAALSPFGVDLKTAPKAEREVHRVSECRQVPPPEHSRDGC